MTLVVQPKFFDNYTKRPARLPMVVWHAARIVGLGITIGMAAALIAVPDVGLKIFWGVAIPVLPIVLVFAPGLWRQVCPMAALNQLPRGFGFSLGRTLPDGLKTYAFAIAVAGFAVPIALRTPLLNHSGLIVGAGVLGALVLAFCGGLVFKGRSGWCGTFCPLAPIQRTYGQAPVVVVRNGYCPTCVGCQKNCYDFNPRAAVFSDVYDDDPRYASQRRLFMGLLPGLIFGHFAQGANPAYGEPWHALILVAACCASAGLYELLVSFVPINPYRIATAFGAVAMGAFYWFTGPTLLGALAHFANLAPPDWLIQGGRGIGFVGALVLLFSGLRSERQYRATQNQSVQAAVDGSTRALKERLSTGRGKEVTDRASGVTFEVAAQASLLEAIQSAGLKINYGCRSGVCGADAVAICEGMENLSPPGEDELATLRRLGLEGRARLACVCQVKGPVLIDRDPNSSAAAAPKVSAMPRIDKAELAGLKRVVIVGNGIAGMSVAETLRRDSPSVDITIVTSEPQHFYNRMAIGRLIYDGSGMDGLQLVPDAWFTSNNVTVLRNTVAASINRPGKQLVLGTGKTLPYDKLVLATGARSMIPDPDFLNHANAFVLRSAEDAQTIRTYVQRSQARRAVVIGGGVLGVEAADALHHLGLKVMILQRADRLMNAQLDENGAGKLTAYLESTGIQVVPNVTIKRFEGADTITAAWLSHGPRVRADLYVACLGIETNAFLATKAGLDVGRGVRVNASMQTSDPEIYAVGDVAELKNAPGGLWPIGVAQAATAVASMFGLPTSYAAPRVVLRLKCDGIDLHSFGDVQPADDLEEVTSRPEDPAWWRFNLRHGDLVGGLYVGPPNTGRRFAKLLQSPDEFAAIKDELRAGNHEVLHAPV